jgi:hypothetical protein
MMDARCGVVTSTRALEQPGSGANQQSAATAMRH